MAVNRICDFEMLNSLGHLEGNFVNPRKPVVEVMDDTVASILRGKTEVQRLKIAMGIWRSARIVLRGAIRTEHPDWSEEQVNREIAIRFSHGAVRNVKS